MSQLLETKYIKEPELEFGFDQRLDHPRDGLYLFGPVSNVNEIRYGVIGTPDGIRRFQTWAKKVHGFIDISEPTAQSKSVVPHHIPFPGFEQAFNAKWDTNPTETIQNIDAGELDKVLRIGNRYEAVKKAVDIYVQPLIDAENNLERSPSFWFIVIPEFVYKLGRPKSRLPKNERLRGEVSIPLSIASQLDRQPTLFGDDDKREAEIYKYKPDFRSQLKARLLGDRIVTQIVRETTLTPDEAEFVSTDGKPRRRIQDSATAAWNLCTGAYYKSGGNPWQLADVRAGVCYVGLVYKKTDASAKNSRHACCAAQMFLSDGDGVVFRGALGPWYSPDTKQFHLNEKEACNLISEVAKYYRNTHKGKNPTELFLHAKSKFSEEEWEGFEQGCPKDINLVGVQIRDASEDLKLFRTGNYPVIRGTAVMLNPRDALLWTAGYVPRLDTYMGPETPNPIRVIIQKGQCATETVLSDVLGLTKINFNSCLYNDRFPVTIRFADAVGDVLVSAPIESEPRLPFKFYI